jgi:CRP-like cAMP-binding protein
LRDHSHEQIKLDKDLNILESIRVTYPTMTFKLYSKIQNHLLNISKTRKKTGISLLINGIPDTIKSELLLRIYSKVIREFSIFKNVNNSRFVLQVLTSFIPITLKKEEILLLEGEDVNNVIFVKDGRLSMEIAIDINDPYKSIQNYFENNFIGITKQEIKPHNTINKVGSLLNMKRNYNDLKAEIDNVLLVRQNNIHNSSINDAHGISKDLGRLDFTRKESDLNRLENYEIVKIFDVRKNEYFGDVHMLLEKPSPFTLKAKSRIVEIFLLRKQDVMNISENFPNIWRKIHDKSYHNLLSIKKLAFKTLSQYYNTHFYHKKNRDKNFGFNMDNSLSKSYSFIDKPSFTKGINTKKKIKLIKQNNHTKQTDIIKKNKSSKIKFKNNLFTDKMNPRKSSEKTLHCKFGLDSGKTNSSFRISQTLIKPILNTSPKEIDNLSNNTNGFNSNNNFYTKTKSYKRVVTFKEDNKKIGEYAWDKKFFNNNNKKRTLLKSKTKFSKLNTIKDVNNTCISEFNEIIKSINGSRRESDNINIENNNDNDESLSKETIKVCKTEGNLKGVNLGKENIFTLEDIDYNFSKRMKKKMRMRKKIEKIIDSLELKRKENNKYLFNIYSNIIGKKLNPILKNISTTDDVSCLQNSIAEELVNITFTNDNSNVFSNLLDSTSSEEDSKKKFGNNSLNIITQEFFEIKSSYKNINVLSKGKIIKSLKYKKFVENFIKINANKNLYNDKLFKALITKYTEKPKKNRTKELKYIRSGTDKYHNKMLPSERVNSFNSKKKGVNATQSNIKLNISSNNNLGIYLNDKKSKNSYLDIEDKKENYKQSGFHSFIRNITKTEENNNTNEKNLNTETNFYKEEEKNLSKTKYLEIPKNNKNIINYNCNNNTNNKSYTSSINIINESEKNDFPLHENQLELLNRNRTTNYRNKTKTTLNNNLDNNDSQNNKCEIF